MDQDTRTESAELPSGVGQTAIGVARGRAVESRRTDRLFDDPLAAAFVEAAGANFESTPSNPGMDIRPMRDAYVAIRTRFFDDALIGACADGIRQVVILGAGLDARAFRLPWPDDTRVFELDVPDVFDFKERVLTDQRAKARCGRVVVRVDLRKDWPAVLRARGFRPDQRSAWLLEGLLMYLTQSERDLLLSHITAQSATDSRMAVEPPTWQIPAHLASTLARGTLDQSTIATAGKLAQAAVEDAAVADPAGWLRGCGWRAELFDVAERFAAYGRELAPGVAGMLSASRRWLATAERSAG
jgi:methyltransferase (TIGR00027 family)